MMRMERKEMGEWTELQAKMRMVPPWRCGGWRGQRRGNDKEEASEWSWWKARVGPK